MSTNRALIPTASLNADLDASFEDVAGQISASSRRVYRLDAQTFATWLHEQALTPQTLTRSHMITYRAFLQENYQKSTAERKLVVARRILAEQVKAGKIATNPAEDIKGFKLADETTHMVMTEQEAQALLDAIDTTTLRGQRDCVLILLLLRTGIRRAEAAALNLDDFRMEQGHHTAVIQHGKGDKRRVVKVPVDVWRVIEAYVAARRQYHGQAMTAGDPLFVSFRKGDRPTRLRLTDKAIEIQVKAYAAQAGLDRLTPHGLRATFITLALEGDAPLQKVQYAAGHRDPRTTERYQGRKQNLDDNAVDYVKVRMRH